MPTCISRSSRTRSRSTSCSRSAIAAPSSRTSCSTTRAGLRHYTQDFLHGFDGIQALGRAQHEAHPDFFAGEVARGPLRRRGRHGLHVRDDRQAEGRVPHAQRADRRGPRRRRVRPADARRGCAVVPADGLDRRSSVLLLRGALRRLHDQLSGVRRHGDDRPARDRPDVLFRAARSVRAPADAGDDPHGGRGSAQALGVSLFHGRRAPLRRGDPGQEGRHRARRPPPLRARRRPHLRAAAQRARHEPHPRRVHRGCGHRARSLPLLPLASAST